MKILWKFWHFNELELSTLKILANFEKNISRPWKGNKTIDFHFRCILMVSQKFHMSTFIYFYLLKLTVFQHIAFITEIHFYCDKQLFILNFKCKIIMTSNFQNCCAILSLHTHSMKRYIIIYSYTIYFKISLNNIYDLSKFQCWSFYYLQRPKNARNYLAGRLL